MPPIEDWSGVAYNPATASENRIHADDVARRYGFRGGLVPGVGVYAYMVQPAVESWGIDWLTCGNARVVLQTPLYDGGRFDVRLKDEAEGRFHAKLLDADGVCCADGEAGLTAPAGGAFESPALRGDPRVPAQEDRPAATRDALERLRETGLGAFHGQWAGDGPYGSYARDPTDMPEILQREGGGFANPGFSLGLANTALASNVTLGPWIHVQSDVSHFAPIPLGARLTVEARIEDLFEKRGHEFVDLDVGVFLDPDQPALRVRHRAIYVLREPAE